MADLYSFLFISNCNIQNHLERYLFKHSKNYLYSILVTKLQDGSTRMVHLKSRENKKF